ncbi:DUF3515 domain-containing protein [Nocardiopsis sp. MG754419]|uniref:DUF3515 domain-containing protein n=1 Tax=Nocardiopsis sp. MG754419 TaxID=2259865 RepID=UPI001BA7E89D|nr:DUF3515 domain-containing protein [Nocardiopsis sp. MG754419]MBR8740520.1 DUF3515 domain-containing protein [Nocardiopsis sp. MG754419]
MLKRYWGAAAVVVLLAAGCGQTVQMQPFEAQPNTAEPCADLVADLPDTLLGADRATIRPESDVMAAWGDPPIGLRCGVPRPAGLEIDSLLQEVGEVLWLPQPEDAPTMFVAVQREAYVELTIPTSYGAPAGALSEVSELVAEHLEERADSGV